MTEARKIKALIMDVDGTLTDGGVYIGADGEIMKRFNSKDGYGIHELLPRLGILPIIITGRTSQIVLHRCKELGITRVVQGSRDKVKAMMDILQAEGIELSETAYIGDDMNDYECMRLVGIKGCPGDAVPGIKAVADYISPYNGGCGAVRDFIEWLLRET